MAKIFPLSQNGPTLRDNELVRHLFAIKKPRMLEGFSKLLFEFIRDEIAEISHTTNPYNPFLYEPLLQDAAKLLDKCLAYRAECAELEALAVRRALEYDLFEKLVPIEDALLPLQNDTKVTEKQKQSHTAAAEAFNSGENESLLKGLAALYSKGAEALEVLKTVTTDTRTHLETKLKNQREYQKALEDCHTTPGHALNFGERRYRVIQFLLPDVREAYQKANAARVGLQTQLDVVADEAYAFPTMKNDDREDVYFLDHLVLWTRNIMQKYELATKDEVEFERVIPLAGPWTYDDQNKPMRLTQKFGRSLTDKDVKGRFDISIAEAIPKSFEKVRIRGIALSAGHQLDENFLKGSALYRSWAALIFPPDQQVQGQIAQDNNINDFKRSPTVLGRIPIFRGDVILSWYSGESIWNTDPASGQWTIVVEPSTNVVTSDSAAHHWPRGTTILQDLKLHLKLVAKPKQHPADWTSEFIR